MSVKYMRDRQKVHVRAFDDDIARSETKRLQTKRLQTLAVNSLKYRFGSTSRYNLRS